MKEFKTKYSADDISQYFLFKAETSDREELLSNLKLQKLVYYAQGLYLAMFNKPLFDEKIEAWPYGPVIPELYNKFKKYGRKGISANKTFDSSKINRKDMEFLDNIYNMFGQFSGSRLIEISHSDACWENAWQAGSKEITHESMKECLKKYIE
jgi:uncharacterized phage-associated protein